MRSTFNSASSILASKQVFLNYMNVVIYLMNAFFFFFLSPFQLKVLLVYGLAFMVILPVVVVSSSSFY